MMQSGTPVKGFQHLAPPLRVFQGSDSLSSLGRELGRLGCSKSVIFCGASLGRHPSALALVKEALGERCIGVFQGVQAHSPLPSVQEGARELARLQADSVIAVGGGSAVVTARAASILLAEGQDIHRLCTQRASDGRLVSPRLPAPKLAQFVVPTTPTTACVKAGSAVFDPAGGQRLALFDPKTRAQALFVHPELIMTAPAALVLSASLNTLAMAVEGLASASCDPLADAQLMHALRLLSQRLPLAGGAQEAAARADLIMSAVLCGQGTDFSGGGVNSVLGHALGARLHLDNGTCNAVLLVHTMAFNAGHTAARAPQIAAALGAPGGGDAVEAAITAVGTLLARLPIPRRLRELGVPQEALDSVAEHAMTDWFLQKNPRPVRSSHELADILRAAW